MNLTITSHSTLDNKSTETQPETKSYYQRRSRTDILIDILNAAGRDGNTKCKIQYKALLSWTQTKQYFNVMIENELLGCKEGKNCYYCTDKGQRFLDMMHEIHESPEIKELVGKINLLYERKQQLRRHRTF